MTETPAQQSPESPTPSPKRRWLQFNLRTLLVLTLVIGSGLGWVMNERRKNARIQADLDALERFGCSFGVLEGNSFRPSRFDWLLDRNDFRIDGVFCDDSTITDTGLVHFKGLTNLNSLYLHNTAITDSGLAHLKDFPKLEYLFLNGTAITDAGLEHLKGLAQLGYLNLRGTKATKSGVSELQKALPNCDICHGE